jgi:hypothetical protein
MTKRLITLRGFEAEGGPPVETQEKLIRRGEGPPVTRIGRKYYYIREELDGWLQDQHVKTAAPGARAPAPKVALTVGDDSLAATVDQIIKTTPMGEETRKRITELLGADESGERLWNAGGAADED